MPYSTPKEFAEYIKKKEYQYEMDPEDIEIRQNALRKHYGADNQKEYDEINTKFQEVIDNIVEECLSIMPEQIQLKFKDHVYFSTIDNRIIRASIRKAPEKPLLAILINSSLIALLTKLGKLDAALHNPNCLVFCSRFPDTIPTREEIKSMRNEMYSYFIGEKMHHGPFLIIKGNEAQAHFAKLDIQEKFILLHEIGHLLNGDLSKNNNKKLSPSFSNISHQREILADLVGFGLLILMEKKRGDVSIERRLQIMFALINLFDVMNGLQSKETEGYPLPLNRMNAIIEYYYGVEIADIVEQTYYDKKAILKLLPNNCPTIQSHEDEMEIYIKKSLDCAFDFMS